NLEPKEMLQLFSAWRDWLKNGYFHVGLSQRQGNNRIEQDDVWNTRMNSVYCHDVEAQRRRKLRWDRTPVMEDFDMTLQLLRSGVQNRVSYKFAHDQNASNTAGGCSLWRTNDVQKQGAERLAELHPGFVRVVTKKTKNGWFGDQERADVVVSWKKAYESSQ
ncbi:MAG TPA: hypothetical protein VF493_19995, partial [Terriglobales bacterium]